MKLNTFKFGLAWAISAALLWVICSVLVFTLPAMILSVSGDMMHMRLDNMGWHVTFSGVVIGLIGWFISAGAMGWLVAAIYNRLQ